MDLLKEFISEYGTTVLYAVITALAGYIGIVLKRLYTKLVNDKTKQSSLRSNRFTRTFTATKNSTKLSRRRRKCLPRRG